MSKEWIEQELESSDMEDQRLNKRFAEVLTALSERPNFSIPTAYGGHSETMGAYRFFDNEKTTFEKIIRPHDEKTRQRIAAQNVILLVQDSTTIDLTKPVQQVKGAGPIGNHKKGRGAMLHLLEAFTPDGTPMGAAWSKIVIRPELDDEEELKRAAMTKAEKIKAERLKMKRPIEEKESFRPLPGGRLVLPHRYDKPLPLVAGVNERNNVKRIIEGEAECLDGRSFKTLKSGCGVEKLRFETMDRLLPCLAVYLIVAWRVLMICRLGRVETEVSCEIIFDPAEWQATFRVMHSKKPLPKTAPSLKSMLRLVGELGGWVSTPGRKDMPGPQTTWIGLQRVRDLAWAWKMFGPEAEKYEKDV